MGAVNTTYTFTATDTITSAKMNNIIDETTMTSDAIIGTTLDVANGQLKIRSQGITSNEMADNSVTQTKLGANVVGNGPCFKMDGYSAVTNMVYTKIAMTSTVFDTNNNVSNGRFTPKVPGYYLFVGRCGVESVSLNNLNCYIYKNGAINIVGTVSDGLAYVSVATGILYMNGTTDYVELYTIHSKPGTYGVFGYLEGALIRSA